MIFLSAMINGPNTFYLDRPSKVDIRRIYFLFKNFTRMFRSSKLMLFLSRMLELDGRYNKWRPINPTLENLLQTIVRAVFEWTVFIVFCTAWSPWHRSWHLPSCSNIRGACLQKHRFMRNVTSLAKDNCSYILGQNLSRVHNNRNIA